MNRTGQLQQNCPQTQKERKEKHQKHQRNRESSSRSKHEKFAFEHHTAEKSDKAPMSDDILTMSQTAPAKPVRMSSGSPVLMIFLKAMSECSPLYGRFDVLCMRRPYSIFRKERSMNRGDMVAAIVPSCLQKYWLSRRIEEPNLSLCSSIPKRPNRAWTKGRWMEHCPPLCYRHHKRAARSPKRD